MSELVNHDGRVVLKHDEQYKPVPALDVFRVAVRGAREVMGQSLAAPVAMTLPGVRFRQEPASVGAIVLQRDSEAWISPAVRLAGGWQEFELPSEEDHVLVGEVWTPLEQGSFEAVSRWFGRREDGPLLASEYVSLYADGGPGFEIEDRLSNVEVDRLPGGSAAVTDLAGTLYPYQETGLAWLSARWRARLGGILGDQMGLGKTLQVIALLQQRGRTRGPCLIVVPLTLVENWTREMHKFAPALQVYRHVGPRRTFRPTELEAQQVVITSYETAVSDRAVLTLVDWDVVVLDEAQAIKNPSAQRTRAVKELPRQSAFAVSGTPLENRVLDVWSLAGFAVPGYFGELQSFLDRYEANPDALRLALRPVLLRREVADVAKDLPERIDVDIPLEMFAPERQGYEAVVEAVRRDSEGGIPILALITRLRLFTAHPDQADGVLPQPEARSAKLARLMEILDEIIESNAKALIFVAFTVTADIVTNAIQSRWGIPTWTLDGRTKVADRLQIVDDYSSTKGAAVLVLNPAAGGTGLNIQAASHVIHYTLEWNPAREDQATARAWRRGQTLPVTVHRLFYVDSIDEFIQAKLTTKRELFEQVITPTEESHTLKELLAMSIDRPPAVREGTTHDFNDR